MMTRMKIGVGMKTREHVECVNRNHDDTLTKKLDLCAWRAQRAGLGLAPAKRVDFLAAGASRRA
jgi:hypothetical protein